MIAGGGRWSRAQIAGVVGVVVVVLGLFGFMALNSGSDGPSDEVAAEGTTVATSTSTSSTEVPDAPSVTAAPMPTAVPTTLPPEFADEEPGDDIGDDGEDLVAGESNPAFPVDGQRFCAGADGIRQLEGSLSGAFAAQDLEGVRRAVAEHREGWAAAVTELIEAGPPRNRVDFERYRSVYDWLLGIIDTEGDLERIGNGYPPEFRDRSTNPDDAIDAAVREHCG